MNNKKFIYKDLTAILKFRDGIFFSSYISRQGVVVADWFMALFLYVERVTGASRLRGIGKRYIVGHFSRW